MEERLHRGSGTAGGGEGSVNAKHAMRQALFDAQAFLGKHLTVAAQQHQQRSSTITAMASSPATPAFPEDGLGKKWDTPLVSTRSAVVNMHPSAVVEAQQPAAATANGLYTESDMSQMAAAAYARAMKDASAMFMMESRNVHQQPANGLTPIIIHNNASSESLTASTQHQVHQQHQPKNQWLSVIETFWASRTNQWLVLGLSGFAAWLIIDIRRQQRRAELIKRRLEYSPLLRVGRWLSNLMAANDF